MKVAWAELRGGVPVVTRRELLRLPYGADDVSAIVLPWLEQHKLSQTPCVIGISGAQTMFQPFLLPQGDPRSLDAAAAMETVRYNEMASEEMVYGFTPIALGTDEKRLLLAMTRPSVLDRLLETARKATLNIVDIVPTPVAMFRSLAKVGNPDPEAPTLYLGVGHSSTDLAIGSPTAGLLFARAFSFGGQLFSESLARGKKLSYAQAENLKVREGSLLPDSDTAHALRAAADQWISEIDSCLTICRSVFGGRKTEVALAVLAGGGGRLIGLAEYLGAKQNLTVETASPEPATPEEPDALAFAAADGLALCGLESTATHISLLPARMRNDLTFREQKPYWIGAGVAAALILAVSLAGGFRDVRRHSTDLRAKRESLRRRQDLVTQIESFRERGARVRGLADPLRTIATAGPTMRSLITLVAERKSPEDLIVMICDADSYFHEEEWNPDTSDIRSGMRDRRAAAKRADAREQQLGIQRVIIEGYTFQPGYATVKRLIEALREVSFVHSADLLSDDKRVESETPASRRGRPFVIDVGLAQP